MKTLKLRWVVIDGSIYTEQKFEFKGNTGVKFMARLTVALNVGEIAHHIVSLHNATL